MKQVYKYLLTALLMILFSIKVGAQAFSSNHTIQKSPVEQEGKSAEDNCLEKSTNKKVDFLSVACLRCVVENNFSYTHILAKPIHTSLPVQYFAIPTPPPWNY